MQKLTFALLLLCLVGGGASSQIWMDYFNYPNGTTLGAWNELVGDWTVNNNIAEAEAKFLWQYAVQPNLLYQDCVAQCLVIKNGGTVPHTLQFGGIALRCNSASDTVMVKVQNNSSAANPTAFDSIWLYEQPGSATAKTSITPTFPKATVRLLLIDQRAEAHIDSDLDGLWDHKVVKTLTNAPKNAPVGIDGFGGVQIDDFMLYDGVLLDDVASNPPNPGNEIKFVMRGFPVAQYVAASSLGNVGIPLPDGRIVPLAPDGMFFASAQNLLPTLFKNYQGVMDGNGDAGCSIDLPNIPALVGVTIYTAFINTGSGFILNISNDHQSTIVP